jgi:hypothetical protein
MALVMYVRSPSHNALSFPWLQREPCPTRCVFYFPSHYYYHHRYNHLSKLSSSRSARSNLVHRLKDVRSVGEGLGRSRRGAPWRCKEVLVVCKKLHATSLYKHRVSLQAVLLGSSVVVGPIQRPSIRILFSPRSKQHYEVLSWQHNKRTERTSVLFSESGRYLARHRFPRPLQLRSVGRRSGALGLATSRAPLAWYSGSSTQLSKHRPWLVGYGGKHRPAQPCTACRTSAVYGSLSVTQA